MRDERAIFVMRCRLTLDSIKTRVESAHGFSALSYNMMERFRTLLSISTCAATAWQHRAEMPVILTETSPGEAVQVGPMKPKLKPPGTKRLKLKYGKLLSKFAFNFNLRRFTPTDRMRGRRASRWCRAASGRAEQLETCVCKHGIRCHWRV